ncbi:MAG: LysR family transcriptional regulator [Bryobacteraceae bacterium]|jgi:DNA-binding transcriptional LysR family regulator
MTLEHLKLFRDIAHARNVSHGAEVCGVSQSAASQYLHETERLLGVQLLDRSTRPVELTEAGRLYYEFCRDVLRRREEFEESLETLKGRVQGTVRVAAIYSVGLSDMSRLERELSRRMPEAVLLVEYLRPEKVYDAVVTDQADLGLVSYPESNREITAIPWREEKMMVAAAPSHPLAARETLDLADLAQQSFVAFDDDLRVGREVKRYMRENGAQLNVAMHFDNIQTMKEAVVLGSSISIMPVRVLRNDIEQGRLVAIPIKGCTLVRPLGIIHRRRKTFNQATRTFLELLRQEAALETTPALPPRQPARLGRGKA